jgi:hypothetical protein
VTGWCQFAGMGGQGPVAISGNCGNFENWFLAATVT